MIRLWHLKRQTVKDRYKWFVYGKDIKDLEGCPNNIINDSKIKVKFTNMKVFPLEWFDGDYPDYMDLKGPNVTIKLKYDNDELKLFVTFDNSVKCIWD